MSIPEAGDEMGSTSAVGETPGVGDRDRAELTPRDVVLFVAGWMAGAYVLSLASAWTKPADDEVGVFLLPLVLWFAVLLVTPLVIERRWPRWPTGTGRADVRWGVGSLLGCLTLPAVMRAAARGLNAGEAWLVLGALTAAVVAVYAALGWVPGLRARFGARAPAWVGPAAVLALSMVAIAGWATASASVASGTLTRLECVFENAPYDSSLCALAQPTSPAISSSSFMLAGAVAAAAVAARFVDWLRLTAVVLAMLYAALVLWAEGVGTMLAERRLVMNTGVPQLAVLLVVSGGLFLLAIVVNSVFPRSPLLPERWRLETVRGPSAGSDA